MFTSCNLSARNDIHNTAFQVVHLKKGWRDLIQGSRIETYKENIGKHEMSWIENTSIFLPSPKVKKEY